MKDNIYAIRIRLYINFPKRFTFSQVNVKCYSFRELIFNVANSNIDKSVYRGKKG